MDGWIIELIGYADGRPLLPLGPRHFICSFDPAAKNGSGLIHTTCAPWEARTFPHPKLAVDYWRGLEALSPDARQPHNAFRAAVPSLDEASREWLSSSVVLPGTRPV